MVEYIVLKGGVSLPYIFDIALFLVFAAAVIFGAVNGFIKSALGLVSIIAAFLLAYQLSAVLAPQVYESFVRDRVYEAIETKLAEAVDATSVTAQVNAFFEAIPKSVLNIATAVGADTASVGEKIQGLDNQSTAIAADITDKVAAPVIGAVLRVVLFAVLVFLLYVIFMVAVKIIDKIFELPFLKTANRLFGGLLGAFKGLIALVVICMILEFVLGAGEDTVFEKSFNASYIAEFINDKNPLIGYFSK